MEEVKNRIIELDLQNALLKGTSDPAKSCVIFPIF